MSGRLPITWTLFPLLFTLRATVGGNSAIGCREVFSSSVGGMVWGVAMDEANGLLVAPCLDHSVYIWNISAHWQKQRLRGHQDEVWRAIVVRGGEQTMIVTASLDGTVRLWRASALVESSETLFNGTFMVTALASNGTTFAHGDKGGHIGVWQISGGHLEWCGNLKADTTMIQAMAFSPEGLLLSASDDGVVRVWDLSAQIQVRQWRANNGSVVAMAVRSDGAIVTSGYDRIGIREPWNLQQWNLNSKRLESSSMGFGIVTALAFVSASGNLLLGGVDNHIFIVSLPGWEIQEVLAGHTDAVHAVHAFGDAYVLSGGADSRVKLWKCRTCDEADASGSQSKQSQVRTEL